MLENKRFYTRLGDRHFRESYGLYYEEFEVGDRIDHRPGRTLTEADNIWQSLINMNISPLHIDSAYCAHTRWEKPLISSLVTFAAINGMTVSSLSARAIANLGWDKVRMVAPVFAGDTVYARSEVLSKRLSGSAPHQGIVTCATQGLKADGTLFLTCERTFLVPTMDHPDHREAGY